jgi:hypothetical protein
MVVLSANYKQNATNVISLVITLAVAHGLKLQISDKLSLDNFDRKWLISVGGLVIGLIVNQFATSKILDKLMDPQGVLNKYTDKNSLGNKLVKDIVETGIMLLTAQVFTNVMNGEDISLTPKLFRYVFLAISGILVYDILIDPLIKDNGRYSKEIKGVLKRTMSIAASEYMADLDFDNFPVEAGTTAAGIIIGDLSSTPIADKLFTNP